MKAVASGECGINRAALDYGVPCTTLKDRLSGRVEHGRKPGPALYLNAVEEKELGEFLKSCASIGYGKTRTHPNHYDVPDFLPVLHQLRLWRRRKRKNRNKLKSEKERRSRDRR